MVRVSSDSESFKYVIFFIVRVNFAPPSSRTCFNLPVLENNIYLQNFIHKIRPGLPVASFIQIVKRLLLNIGNERVLVCVGCCYNILQSGWYIDNIYFSQLCRLESPQSKCWHIWCLAKARFLVHRLLSSCCVFT